MKSDNKILQPKYSPDKLNQTQLKDLNQSSIYFQKQSSTLLCGLHAVNNFLGLKKYTPDQMNQICYSLAGGKKLMNPHKHWMMDGDFDVNVLMVALGKENYEANWHDQRKDFSYQVMKNTEGFLINIQSRRGFWFSSCCYSGRHWLTMKKIRMKNEGQMKEVYVILDSLENAYRIINEQQAIEYLKTVEKQNGQVLLIQKLSDKGIKTKIQ